MFRQLRARRGPCFQFFRARFARVAVEGNTSPSEERKDEPPIKKRQVSFGNAMPGADSTQAATDGADSTQQDSGPEASMALGADTQLISEEDQEHAAAALAKELGGEQKLVPVKKEMKEPAVTASHRGQGS